MSPLPSLVHCMHAGLEPSRPATLIPITPSFLSLNIPAILLAAKKKKKAAEQRRMPGAVFSKPFFLLLLLYSPIFGLSPDAVAAGETWPPGMESGRRTAEMADTAEERAAEGWPVSVRRRRLLGYTGDYISYIALLADRAPCPPGCGRSYYTFNCYEARGQVRPYEKGCSAITLCARYSG